MPCRSTREDRASPTFATHRFSLAHTMIACDTFADAAATNALKAALEGGKRDAGSNGHISAALVALVAGAT